MGTEAGCVSISGKILLLLREARKRSVLEAPVTVGHLLLSLSLQSLYSISQNSEAKKTRE
jgi:hypothetical protein